MAYEPQLTVTPGDSAPAGTWPYVPLRTPDPTHPLLPNYDANALNLTQLGDAIIASINGAVAAISSYGQEMPQPSQGNLTGKIFGGVGPTDGGTINAINVDSGQTSAWPEKRAAAQDAAAGPNWLAWAIGAYALYRFVL